MRSALFYGTHDVRIEEQPIPQIKNDEVLIRVKACGLCGTDVLLTEGGKADVEVIPPVILGHEFSGIIEAVGSEVTTLHVGDRVCVNPHCSCGSCEPCRNGAVHLCEQLQCYGMSMHGGMSEYCAVKASQVYLLKPTLTFEQGAMIEPLSCCLHGIDRCHLQSGQNVVIIGGGMIGLLMVQLARLSGAGKIALLEPQAHKRQLAIQLGADIGIDPLYEDVSARLAAAEMKWVHTVIECVGRPSTMKQAMELAGRQGTVMLCGLTPPQAEVTFKPFEVFKKELTVCSSFINPFTMQRALDLAASGRIDVKPMIAQCCDLSELPSILKDPQQRAKGKYIFIP